MNELAYASQDHAFRTSFAEKRFARFCEMADEVFFSLDRNLSFTYINTIGESIIGYPRREILGRMTLADVIHPLDADIIGNLTETIMAGSSPEKAFSFRVLDPEGVSRTVEMRISVFRDNNETEILGIGRHAPEQEKESGIKQTREEFEVLFNSITDGISVVDREYRILRANQGMAHQRGLPLDKMIGERCYEIYYGRPSPCDNCVVERTFRTGEASSKTRERIRNDGTIVSAEVLTFPIVDCRNEVIQVVEYSRDITEKKALEQQLLQAQKMESIGVLAGGIAHDFNNLLSGILGYASLLKTKLSSGHQFYKYADTIENSAVKAARLINQLLTFSRAGKSSKKIIDINSIIRETIQILERAIDKGIRIQTEMEDSLWALAADPFQIEQVLLNICINARDAMPDGGVLTIKTENTRIPAIDPAVPAEVPPGRYVRISVSDTGAGMEKNIQGKIFDPFFTTKDKTKGTGLGLAVVYGIVKDHNGHIQVESEPGKGAKFDLYIPASTKKPTDPAPGTELKESFSGSEIILLVDDEDVVRGLGKEILEYQGYKVILAGNGLEAVGIYEKQNQRIDLVILDIIMPGISGVQTFERLKAINPAVKVIFSSGYSPNGCNAPGLKADSVKFIQKPYKMEELSKLVRRTLDET
ncbi:MAG: PAS domain S-box protein [Pseudomonadota bacterium]